MGWAACIVAGNNETNGENSAQAYQYVVGPDEVSPIVLYHERKNESFSQRETSDAHSFDCGKMDGLFSFDHNYLWIVDHTGVHADPHCDERER